MGSQTVFKRVEKKYLLDGEQYRRLREGLEAYLEPDEYGESQIYSLYFDTPDYLLIRRSLEKPVYKEKLRLRSYGEPGPESEVFVELKKKYKGVVYKRRMAMEARPALDWLCGGPAPAAGGQIQAEIQWALDLYGMLRPSMELRYDRTALRGRADRELRLTFDRTLLARPWGGQDWAGLLPPESRLMEIKLCGGMPLWMAELLDELAIFPNSFSKYGKAYQSMEAHQQLKGVHHCA